MFFIFLCQVRWIKKKKCLNYSFFFVSGTKIVKCIRISPKIKQSYDLIKLKKKINEEGVIFNTFANLFIGVLFVVFDCSFCKMLLDYKVSAVSKFKFILKVAQNFYQVKCLKFLAVLTNLLIF